MNNSADPNTPLALLLIGGSALCAFMAVRPWPQSGGKSVRPEAYARSIIAAHPMEAGPAPANDTAGIETGLKSMLLIWGLSKLAGIAGAIPNFFGGGGSNEGSGEGEGDEGGGGEGISGELEQGLEGGAELA